MAFIISHRKLKDGRILNVVTRWRAFHSVAYVLKCVWIAGASSVDGGWSDWSHLDACSATACSHEIGFRIRFRSCTSPSPMFGGLPCQGRSWKRETCYNNDFCIKPGTSSEFLLLLSVSWFFWSTVSVRLVLSYRALRSPYPGF